MKNEAYTKEFVDFIVKKGHPCTMAQSIVRTDKLNLHSYAKTDINKIAVELLYDIKQYVKNYDFRSKMVETFLAVFPNIQCMDEIEFESWLWNVLQEVHNIDDSNWDPSVSDNPSDNNFSFSIGGSAFYIVGMHPKSSRISRKAPYLSIAFNLHSQFEELRSMKVYETVKNRIRKRDKALQGTTNPMLENFGRSSEAKQYSGREVKTQWKCPFAVKESVHLS